MDKMDMIKKLRSELMLGFGDCKSALEEVNYNYEEAVKLLRERGKANAVKKSGRSVSEGLVGFAENEDGFSVAEILCETDFVAMDDNFISIVDNVLQYCLKAKPQSAEEVNEKSESVKTAIIEGIAKLGENIQLKKAFFKSKNGNIAYYIHNQSEKNNHVGKILAVLDFQCDQPSDEIKETLRSIAMHIAASNPRFLSIESVPSDVIEEERRIYKVQSEESGKPQQIIEKMIDGRIKKFYQESALTEQTFVFDENKKIKDVISDLSKETNKDIKLNDFYFIKVGV